jgi:hypothetical protein
MDSETLDRPLIERIVSLGMGRTELSEAQNKFKDIDIAAPVRAGTQKVRVFEPSVRLIFKDVAWESSRDDEFRAGEAPRKCHVRKRPYVYGLIRWHAGPGADPVH